MARSPLLPFRAFALAADQKSRLEQLVTKDKVVVFMKGVPDSPRCGFSNAVIQVLRMHAVPYQAYDVLSDEELRQGVKEFSNWPTIPQVYINGQFVGGCDIILQMHRSTDLIDTLKQAGITSALSDQK
jgi:monothiol glutaredoxin